MARKRKIIVPDIQYKEGQNLFDLNSSPELPKVTYELIEEGIKYKMHNDALVKLQESDTWSNIKERIRIRYNNRHIDN